MRISDWSSDVCSSDLEVLLGEIPSGAPAQIFDLDRLERLGRAVVGQTVGMVRKNRAPPGTARDVARVGDLLPVAGEKLPADALDRPFVEARLGQRQAKQLDRFVEVAIQRLEAAAEGVVAGGETEMEREVFGAPVERQAVELAGAFVEQRRGHAGESGLVGGVEPRAAAERELERRYRDAGVPDEPGFAAAVADNALHFDRARPLVEQPPEQQPERRQQKH